MRVRWKIGRHELALEEPDIVLVTILGDVSEDEAVELLTTSDRCAKERDHQFWLVDVSQLGHIYPGARRTAANWKLSSSHWGTVAFGAGFMQRLLARMLRGAAMALRGEVETVVLFALEEEARAWITQERRRRLSAREPGAT
ncbi:MAG: hypothetical protein U1A78_11020 [Polyangia bacterium]